MPRREPTALDDLDELVAAITVDAYGDDEAQSAFLEVFNQEVRLPTAATVLGIAVEVIVFDYHDERRGIVARCRRDGVSQDLAVVDLAFGPDAAAARVQAAYRRWLGLAPHPFDMPAGGGRRGLRTRSLGGSVVVPVVVGVSG